MSDRVSVTVEDGVADVRLVRAEKMNALDDAMFDAIIEAGENLKHRDDIRVAVLSGEGRAFCAGLDMGRFADMASGERRTRSLNSPSSVTAASSGTTSTRPDTIPLLSVAPNRARGVRRFAPSSCPHSRNYP